MDTEKLAPIFEAVQVLSLRPGDMLVFRAPGLLAEQQRLLIREQLETVFSGRRVLVIDGGSELQVVREEKAVT